MNQEAKRKLQSEFTCYVQNIICKYSCDFQSEIGSNHVRHLDVPYHYEMFTSPDSSLSDDLIEVEERIFNAVSDSIKLDKCTLEEGVAQFNFDGESNLWVYSGASLDRAIIVSIASLGDIVDDYYANEYCTGDAPGGEICTPVEGSMRIQYVITAAYDDSIIEEVEKAMLSLIKKEITGGEFTTNNVHYVEREMDTGSSNSDSSEQVGNIQSSGLSQAVGISSIAAIAMFFAGAAFLVKRNQRRKKQAKTGTLSPGKEKRRDVIRLSGTDEELSDDDDDQGVEDPVRSKYYNLQQHRINCLSTISEVSEETDSSVLYHEDPVQEETVNRILSESTYEYRTDAV